MMEKLLKIYNKCMEHNISISIKYLLSDAAIEIEGRKLVYNSANGKYSEIKCDRWVLIEEIKTANIDLIELSINEIFNALNNREN
jgi:hypothetical protein